MTCRRDTRLVGAVAWIIAWSALTSPSRIALGEPGKSGPPDPVRVEGVETDIGPLPEPISIAEAGTVRQLIEIEPKTKGLKDAVVWLEGVPPPAKPTQPIKFALNQMDQRDFRSVPHVLAIDTGQQVEFLDSDAAIHGVSAASFEAENRFNGVTPSGGSYQHRFVASTRPVAIGCPIRGVMSAWIYVFEHPYHTVTDVKGAFRLPPVPPRHSRLRLRHTEGGMDRHQELVVRPGTPVQLRIEFGAKDLRPAVRPIPNR